VGVSACGFGWVGECVGRLVGVCGWVGGKETGAHTDHRPQALIANHHHQPQQPNDNDNDNDTTTGHTRQTGFDITVASEIMAVLALTTGLQVRACVLVLVDLVRLIDRRDTLDHYLPTKVNPPFPPTHTRRTCASGWGRWSSAAPRPACPSPPTTSVRALSLYILYIYVVL
jgi:hypothetical protein